MPKVKVSSKGHVILPRPLREALAVKAGGTLEVAVEKGMVKLAGAPSKADALAGVLRGLAPRPLNWKRLRREVAEQVADDAVKELQPERPD